MSNREIVYWKQRNGVLISIDDMDINHLRNVLKMILRKNPVKKPIGNIERRFLEDRIAEEFNSTEIDIY
jgi:hypothetical protein